MGTPKRYSLDSLPARFPSVGARVLYKLDKDTPLRTSGQAKNRGVVVDIESNCLDGDDAEPVEVCVLPFWFDDDMRLARVEAPYVKHRMPDKADWPKMGSFLGLTKDIVLSKEPASGAEISNLLSGVDIAIAHQASFDRQLLERTWDVPSLVWGCTVNDLPWKDIPGTSAKLDYLAAFLFGFWYEAHGAYADCKALLHILSHEVSWTDGDELALKRLIVRAMTPYYRASAWESPYETKEVLKRRGYSWDTARKVWWKDVLDQEAELEWLHRCIYWNGRKDALTFEPIDPRTRFAN